MISNGTNPFFYKMRELKREEFDKFFVYIKQREPKIRELLSAANDLDNVFFYKSASSIASTPMSFIRPVSFLRDHSRLFWE